MEQRFLTYQELEARGYVDNRATLSKWIKAGTFPAPIKLGVRQLRWVSEEVEQWERNTLRAATQKKPAANRLAAGRRFQASDSSLPGGVGFGLPPAGKNPQP